MDRVRPGPDDLSALARLAVLAVVGEEAFGADWQRPMARALGPHHPDYAREAIDDRLVRRWVSGDRPVPAWVGTVLPTVLRERADTLTARIDGMRRMADALEQSAQGARHG